jgi:hypothetical protein
VAQDARFNELVADVRGLATQTRIEVPRVPPGSFFMRVSAIDAEGFQGPPSAVVTTTVARVSTALDGRGAQTVNVSGGLFCGLDGAPLDFLGLGLAGQRGVTLFLSGLAATVVALAVVGVAARNSWRRRGWAWSVGRHLPLIGPAAVTAAAAWCRAASLAAHAGVSVGEMVQLATLAAPGFGCERHRVEDLLRSGRDLPEALAATGRLPRPVIEAVAVGEATGTTAEALDRVADHLDETAARGFAAAVQAAGFLTWSLVACLVATLVIRVAATYARMIHDAARLP